MKRGLTPPGAAFLLAGMFWLFVWAALSGCASVPNPVAAAETPDQKAFALYGQYTILVETAADLVEDPRVPNPVKLRIQQADARLTPAVIPMGGAARQYRDYRELLAEARAAGQGDRAESLAESLAAWETRLQELTVNTIATMQELSQAVSEATAKRRAE